MTTLDRKSVESALSRNLQTYRHLGEAQGVPPEADDWLYGNAMAHTLFDIEQTIDPVGFFGSVTGKVQAAKERLLLEVVPFSRILAEARETSFIDYCMWSRFGVPIDLITLEKEFDVAMSKFPPQQRRALNDDAQEHGFKWLEFAIL